MDTTPSQQTGLRLDRVAFYGRTLAEYERVFDLRLADWTGGRILDCPAGASSFSAEAARVGMRVVACDPMFGSEAHALYEQGAADVAHVLERLNFVMHLYKWDFYATKEALRDYRTRALRLFTEDYPKGRGEGRYVRAELPRLPFANHAFDITLSGHFLFTYSDKFDYAFHLASLSELLRVSAREVRLYPIQGPNSQPYPHMPRLLAGLRDLGARAEMTPVPFEFQRGSTEMLRLTHG